MSRTVSIAFSSYNQERFVAAALESVLAQDHPSLQVVVYDDGSTDGTQDIIRSVAAAYDGPHDVVLELREENHLPTALLGVLERCDGDYIVRAHGDDISHPNRARRLESEAARLGVSLVASNAVLIDEEGEPLHYWRDPDGQYDCSLERFSQVGLIDTEFGAGLSFERRVWDEFGPRRKGPRNSDGVLSLRGALLDGAHFDPEPTLLYRRHAGQTAPWAMLADAADDRERQRVQERHLQNNVANAVVYIELIQEHLARHPDDEAARAALPGFIGILHRWARTYCHYRDDLVEHAGWLY